MHRSARPAHGFLAAIAVAGALIACTEPPSFELGWRITSDDAVTDLADAPELRSVKQCSEVGIEKVRLEIRGVDDPELAELRFSKDYACFPPLFSAGEPIEGPTLAPGDYELALIGLRRNGAEWLCPGVDEQGNAVEVGCVRDTGSLTVSEGSLPVLEFLLRAPAECDDGVDNDRDGRVDNNDPACLFGEAFESYDAGLTFFELQIGILDNFLIEPRHVGIADFELTIDGAPFETLDPVAGAGLTWPWRFPLLDARLEAGAHTLGLVALANDGPLTQVQTHDFLVDAESGAFVVHEFSLTSAAFLAPIEDPLAVAWAMGDTLQAPVCGAVDDMRVRVREGDTVLPLGVDDLLNFPNSALTNATVEGEWLAFACHPGGRLSSAAALVWTEAGYSIEIEGRVGGQTCFASGIKPLRPGSFSPVGIAVARVLDDQGMPPAGCPQ